MAGEIAGFDLDDATDRVEAGQEAGDTYTETVEAIRDNIDVADGSGSSLGNMVAAQLELLEADTTYQVQSGLPKKVSTAVNKAAQGIKQ